MLSTAFLPHLFPLAMIAGYFTATPWAFRAVGWIVLIVPLLDSVSGVDRRTAIAQQEREQLGEVAMWTFVPLHLAIVWCGLQAVSREPLPFGDLLRLIWSVGLAVGATAGMFGVPVAHELMHRPGRLRRSVAEVQMGLLSYPHFCIEHVEGHHRYVATPRDPATARLGESLFAFYPRVVWGSLRSAWRIEAGRLHDRGIGVLSFHNRMLRYAILLWVLYAVLFVQFGWPGITFFAVQSAVGFSTLEVINYVEHYGLTRRESAPGCYERVGVEHAWNSNHRVSNWLLFNVARHSDHHCDSRRPWGSLRNLDEAPQLPAGYFSMFVLALVPPLWHRVMDPRVASWQRAQDGMSAPEVIR